MSLRQQDLHLMKDCELYAIRSFASAWLVSQMVGLIGSIWYRDRGGIHLANILCTEAMNIVQCFSLHSYVCFFICHAKLLKVTVHPKPEVDFLRSYLLVILSHVRATNELRETKRLCSFPFPSMLFITLALVSSQCLKCLHLLHSTPSTTQFWLSNNEIVV